MSRRPFIYLFYFFFMCMHRKACGERSIRFVLHFQIVWYYFENYSACSHTYMEKLAYVHSNLTEFKELRTGHAQ